ncbi:hypothetical protein UCRNP2_6077 [Neofusicoccum parvum UCRNP2]|uniref:P-loop containing nucleoside triphosphate hydrolase protein n=1 Tax=Botryosphaeria parva (strain UCR-NP2) TaxID=1287680 RepID=R1GME7_BOTPV|nr:hypothetical protein UCRNP2_6077 [Neofusicoccum parvum UCRNP2]
MPSFSRHTNSPKPPSSSIFNFSFDSSKMASGGPETPHRHSVAASDRDSAPRDVASPRTHAHGVDRVVRELTRYLALLKPSRSGGSEQESSSSSDGAHGLHVEELLTTPLFSWSVKLALGELRRRGRAPDAAHFDQFALLGQERGGGDDDRVVGKSSALNPDGVEPIFLNTNAPWSAFLCGSQGSGKSHTLACMLEGCLMQSKALGRLPEPLQGIVFHCDAWSAGAVCEAAHLCSVGIEVNVLVSPSNYWRLKEAYGAIPDPKRCLRVINKILRDMATSAQRSFEFDYKEFLRRLEKERLSPDQKGPMNLRLQLLESFMDVDGSKDEDDDIFKPNPGSLTVVDLTDPFVDASSACTLFDICLALFLEDDGSAGRVIALDEAHKYMTDTASSDRFTESLLTCIRIQRHAACRIIIATQEPTISPRLLDLCSMTVVHRFTSPAWLSVLRNHLAGLSPIAGKGDEEVKRLFEEIVTLKVGESLLFAPSAVVRVEEGGRDGEKKIVKLGTECLRFKTRPRVTNDGGKSVLAIR